MRPNESVEPVRLGVIGAGFISQVAHLCAAQSSQHVTLAGLTDPRAELMQTIAAQFGAGRTYSNYRDLLADPSIEAVLICVHRRCLAPVVLEALQCGKAVLSEKPMATSLKNAEQLVSTAASAELPYAVGFMKRYDPGVLAFRERLGTTVASGDLGPIIHVALRDFCPSYAIATPHHIQTREVKTYRYPESAPAPEYLPEKWWSDFDYSLNVVSHDVNLLRWILRRPIAARRLTVRAGRSQIAHLACDDFEIVLQAGRSNAGTWDQAVEIFFERGQMALMLPSPLARQTVAIGNIRAPGRFEHLLLRPEKQSWSFGAQLNAFADSARGSGVLINSGLDALEDMALLEDLWKRCEWHN